MVLHEILNDVDRGVKEYAKVDRNRFGSIVPIAPNAEAPSAIYNMFDQYYPELMVDGYYQMKELQQLVA